MEKFTKDPAIIFMGIEEARVLGSDTINFILDLGRETVYSVISFNYIASIDELMPIAVIIQPSSDTLKNTSLTTISRVLNEVKGYIYGSENAIGILIPIESEDDLYNKIVVVIPRVVKQVLGVDVKPVITGYSIENAADHGNTLQRS